MSYYIVDRMGSGIAEMSKQKVAEGDLFAVQGGEAFGLAKVIFVSSHYKNLMLIRLFPERADDPNALSIPDPRARSELYYTGVDSARKSKWVHVGKQDVTDEERAMTKRVAAREVWIEDTHLGPATEQDMKTLQSLHVYGHVLISEAVAGLCSVGP